MMKGEERKELLPEKEADGLRVVIFDLGKDVPRLGVGYAEAPTLPSWPIPFSCWQGWIR